MSTSLAAVLMAAMAVPGSGPEMVSAEMDQQLDMSGEWRGICRGWPRAEGETLNVLKTPEGEFALYQGENGVSLVLRWGDEGQGKLNVRGLDDQVTGLGIYQQDGDRLVICLREAENGRPTSFQPAKGQYLLILLRVKPRK